MKLSGVLVALLMISVALAGCMDGDNAGVDSDGLAEGLGGFTGLLVDDRFRPIHLTDNPTGEFQAEGVILVKPLGETIEETTVNGEFELLGVLPGTYELVFQADGYEAAPISVDVEVGVVSEVTLEARRVVNEGGQILTQEYAIFIDCWYSTPIVLHTEVNCFADLSRDSKRGGMRADYTHLDVNYLVTEFLMSDEGNYRFIVGWGEGEVVEGSYADYIEEGVYSKLVLTTDEEEYTVDQESSDPMFDGRFDNEIPWIAVVFPLGEDIPVYEEEMVPEESPRTPRDYAGAGVGTRGQVVTTIFLDGATPPEGQDLADYCVICG